MAVQQSEEILFILNWTSLIDMNCFVEHKGVFYDVKRVDTFEGYKRDLRVYAGRLQTQPKPDDVVGWQG